MHMSTRQRGQVLVTGASTGIGQATALHLHSLGFSVLAGVRRDEDAVLLHCGLTPIHLDVTRPEELTAARAELGDRPLAGLVNNAGITRCGPLEFVPIADLREQFEVNVIGQVAVIQAFIDALRAGRGRVVNIGSISGRLAPPIVGPYAAAKFALNAINDALRRELTTEGIEVIMIEPGSVKTPLKDKTSRMIESSSTAAHPSWNNDTAR